MSVVHLVRVGAMGNVGRFSAIDACRYARGTRVIVRTARGLETGEVLTPVAEGDATGGEDGSLLRRMAVEDELLVARLNKNRNAAIEACTSKIAELGLSATLLDVEHLFDGETLIFYFLEKPSAELEGVLDKLKDVYEAKVEFASFVETVTAGCGPGCGTENATGPGCGTCTTGCAISSVCNSHTL